MLSWGVPACGTMQLSARTGDRFLLQGRCGWEAGVGIVFEAAGQIQVSHGNSRLFCNQRPISGTGTNNWTLVAEQTPKNRIYGLVCPCEEEAATPGAIASMTGSGSPTRSQITDQVPYGPCGPHGGPGFGVPG